MEMLWWLVGLFFINGVLGYLLVRRLRPASYFRILLLGIIQYIATAFVVAVLMSTSSRAPLGTALLEFIGLWIFGGIRFAVFVLPFVALLAWYFHWYFNLSGRAGARSAN